MPSTADLELQRSVFFGPSKILIATSYMKAQQESKLFVAVPVKLANLPTKTHNQWDTPTSPQLQQ